ncbi:MAG: cation transporter [Trueperaceae bacterium]|nr:cation transporter [Trueperaceae bacterium]
MTDLKIEGMTCGHCTAAVTKALEKVAGVSSAQVDLATGQAHVEGHAELAALVAAVQDEGYQAAPLAS